MQPGGPISLKTPESSFKVQGVSQVRCHVEAARPWHSQCHLLAASLSVPLLSTLEEAFYLERPPMEHSSSA